MAKRITNAMIETYCDQQGYEFKIYEPCPWEIPSKGDAGRGASGTAYFEAYPRVQALRRKIIADLRSASTRHA